MNSYEFVKQVKKINPKVKVKVNMLMSALGVRIRSFTIYNVTHKVDAILQNLFSLHVLRNMVKQNIKKYAAA